MNYVAPSLTKESLEYGIYYTVGSDVYWTDYVEKVFRSILEPDSFSLHVLDKINSINEVIDAVSTFSFSGEDNVVIVKDYDFRLPAKEKDVLKSFICDSGYILFIGAKFFAEAKKGKKGEGTVKYAVFSAEEKKLFSAIECEKTDKFACMRYAEKLFPYGIENKAVDLLVEYGNKDMARISMEKEKLLAYCGERKVTVSDVNELVVADTDLQVYNFVNSLVEGNLPLAQKQLDRLIARDEKESVILASLIGQYRRMLYASISPLSDKELAAKFKVGEFAVKKARENRKLKKKQLKDTLDMLVGFEYKFKSGVMSERTAFKSAIACLIAKENV